MPQTRENFEEDLKLAVEEYNRRVDVVKRKEFELESAKNAMTAQRGMVETIQMYLNKEKDGTDSARKEAEVIPFPQSEVKPKEDKKPK